MNIEILIGVASITAALSTIVVMYVVSKKQKYILVEAVNSLEKAMADHPVGKGLNSEEDVLRNE